ncbi:IS66 family transposase [Acinetobacter baumannii]|uniref:IS66 family transposase n=1 Tax=Acinetobacter baumannii TaxID=470 RepID=UPI003AB5074C
MIIRIVAAAYIHDFLAGFAGYLQVDGYAGYEKPMQLSRLLGTCRRKFVEAQKAQGKGKR